jgi:hypothetical protein
MLPTGGNRSTWAVTCPGARLPQCHINPPGLECVERTVLTVAQPVDTSQSNLIISELDTRMHFDGVEVRRRVTQ